MTVHYTEKFFELSQEAQISIKSFTEKEKLAESWYKLRTEQNRSFIFGSDKYNLVLKIFTDKGRDSEDIEALNALSDSIYFPNIYAYKEKNYLIMDKALGKKLSEIIRKVSEKDLDKIRLNLYNALSDMLDVSRYDWDFKYEHIFWDNENSKLTWIDLGLCESTIISSKEDKVNRLKSFYRDQPNLEPSQLIRQDENQLFY